MNVPVPKFHPGEECWVVDDRGNKYDTVIVDARYWHDAPAFTVRWMYTDTYTGGDVNKSGLERVLPESSYKKKFEKGESFTDIMKHCTDAATELMLETGH